MFSPKKLALLTVVLAASLFTACRQKPYVTPRVSPEPTISPMTAASPEPRDEVKDLEQDLGKLKLENETFE